MHPDDDQQAFYCLATRYLVEEVSKEEHQRLLEILKNPARREMFEKMSASWNAAPADRADGIDLEDDIRRVLGCIHDHKAEPAASVEFRPVSRWLRAWTSPVFHTAMAACLTLAMVTLFVILRPGSATSDGAATGSTWIKQVNGVGEHLTLTLDDGTRIMLNAGSTLHYPSAFVGKNRMVRLTGEAYFDVAKDAARPFIVEAPSLRVTVLGTKFNVKAFADGTKSQVTLVQGKVQVTPLGDDKVDATPVTLAPGMQYSIAPAIGSTTIETVEPEAATGWLSDKIVWDREPLPDAMRELERRYGITIEIGARLDKMTITAKFHEESLQRIFRLIHLTNSIDYRFEPSEDKIERVILSAP